MSLPLGYSDLALGTSITLPHIDDKELTIKVPAGTNSGNTITITGRGVPSSRGVGRGDGVVLCKLSMPKKLDKGTKNILDDLRGKLDGGEDLLERIKNDAEDRRR